MKQDLKMWETFLKDPSAYARSFIEFNTILVAQELNFYSDASKNPDLGFGGRFDQDYMYAKWNKNFILENDPSITYLELFALTAAFLAWGHRLSNKRVILYCDNLGACAIVNHTTSSCKNCMVLVRMLVLHQLKYNCRVYARWVSTTKNGPADSLSRLKIDKFLKLVNYEVNVKPTQIPEALWPMEKIWIK